MYIGQFQTRRILTLVVLFSLFSGAWIATADQIPDMTGAWDGISLEQYSEAGGYLNTSSSQGLYGIKTQEGQAFAGEESYKDSPDGPFVTETIAAVLSADGSRFWQDHDGSGLSFGEMVTDHEFYNFMLFPADGPMVVISHMVKSGTAVAPGNKEPVNLVGTWNFTQQRRNETVTNDGVFTIESQRNRIFTGQMQVPDSDGSLLQLKVIGAVGSDGNFYAVADNGAIYVGSVTGKQSMHNVIVHPEDTDKTFVIDRWSSRNGTAVEKSDLKYPVITGNWNISSRIIIQNETITDAGTLTDEWMSYMNQSGPFFTAVRHSSEAGTPPAMEISAIFRGTDEAFLASAAPTFVIYHFPDTKTIEAVIIRNMETPAIFFDTLVQKAENNVS